MGYVRFLNVLRHITQVYANSPSDKKFRAVPLFERTLFGNVGIAKQAHTTTCWNVSRSVTKVCL